MERFAAFKRHKAETRRLPVSHAGPHPGSGTDAAWQNAKEFDVQKPIIERAYELAKSGRCKDVREIERHLKSEGYRGFYADMAGPALRKALRNLCLTNDPSQPVQAIAGRAPRNLPLAC